MCGRYFLDTLPELLAQQFRMHKYPVYTASHNIAPTQPMLVLRAHGEDNEWAWLRWGLIPHWAKDVSIGAKLINARGETVAEKPAFRGAFKYRRCIVPASGFYEWKPGAKGKQPYAIVPEDDPCFGFAGLWEHWTAADGSVLETGSVLTTSANALMAPIHERMPVILQQDAYQSWIHGDPAEVKALIRPWPDGGMRAYPVSRAVGNVRNNSPQLIEPVEAAS
ncbi:MAG: SOS response-associated peptidase [Lysobacterales bacterium]|nr:SOS response-associated peptidase [Rhodanobacteraceae bacterium]